MQNQKRTIEQKRREKCQKEWPEQPATYKAAMVNEK